MYDCMDDCIHLKACRRMQKKGKIKGVYIPRNCNEECTAYQSREEIEQEICRSIEWAFEQGKDGMDYIRYGGHMTIFDYDGGKNG